VGMVVQVGRPDYFLFAFRSLNPISKAYFNTPAVMPFALPRGQRMRNPCRSCIFATSQLEREQSLLRRIGPVPES
jgi:hypothetical protein